VVVPPAVNVETEIVGLTGGGSMVIVGGDDLMYPSPGSVITMPEIVLLIAFLTAYPVAVLGVIKLPTGTGGGAENVMFGADVYPVPAAVTVMSVTEPTTTAENDAPEPDGAAIDNPWQVI